MRPYIHTCVRTSIRTFVCTYVHTYIRTYIKVNCWAILEDWAENYFVSFKRFFNIHTCIIFFKFRNKSRLICLFWLQLQQHGGYEMRATPKTFFHSIHWIYVYEMHLHFRHLQFTTLIIAWFFFRGSVFYVYIESPNPNKTQKAPHLSRESPSTEKTGKRPAANS